MNCVYLSNLVIQCTQWSVIIVAAHAVTKQLFHLFMLAICYWIPCMCFLCAYTLMQICTHTHSHIASLLTDFFRCMPDPFSQVMVVQNARYVSVIHISWSNVLELFSVWHENMKLQKGWKVPAKLLEGFLGNFDISETPLVSGGHFLDAVSKWSLCQIVVYSCFFYVKLLDWLH